MENIDEEIVVLETDGGEKIEFTNLGDVFVDEKDYAVLLPKDKIEGLDDNSALVFEVTIDEEGHEEFEIIVDEEIIEKVYNEYNKDIE